MLDIPKDELAELQKACESQTGVDSGKAVSFPPRARFTGELLCAVFDYHIELGKREQFDPITFIVVTDQDWKDSGVLLVSLDADRMMRSARQRRVAP